MKRLLRQRGQSMVEYVVILGALSAALLYVSYTTRDGQDIPYGYIGSRESDPGSLIQAINQKHRGQGYALSLSEIPETDDLQQLQVYYDRLDKYPELSKQLGDLSSKLGEIDSRIRRTTQVINQIKQYVPPSLPDPGDAPASP